MKYRSPRQSIWLWCATLYISGLSKLTTLLSSDFHILNVMMDVSPMFPKFHHPVDDMMNFEYPGPAKYYESTARPVKYFVMDFGISWRYEPSDIPPMEEIIFGGNKTLPEHRLGIDPCNPFAADIYCLGSLVEAICIEVGSISLVFIVYLPIISNTYLDNLTSYHLS